MFIETAFFFTHFTCTCNVNALNNLFTSLFASLIWKVIHHKQSFLTKMQILFWRSWIDTFLSQCPFLIEKHKCKLKLKYIHVESKLPFKMIKECFNFIYKIKHKMIIKAYKLCYYVRSGVWCWFYLYWISKRFFCFIGNLREHKGNHDMWRFFTGEPIIKAYLGIGDPSNEYNSSIIVYVIDNYFGVANYSIPVQVWKYFYFIYFNAFWEWKDSLFWIKQTSIFILLKFQLIFQDKLPLLLDLLQ